MEENIKRLGRKQYRVVEFIPCHSMIKLATIVHLKLGDAEELSGLYVNVILLMGTR